MSRRIRPTIARVAVLGIALLAGRAFALVSLETTASRDLCFGQIVSTGMPGTVTVDPSGIRSASGGVALGSAAGVGAAIFRVTGEPNASYSITLPSSTLFVSAGRSMTIDRFTSSPKESGNLGPGGAQWLSVGGTLHVGPSQTTAIYDGTVEVTVAYD
ncbi:MAG TPA: DUF4402 domain-containing protein [Patescibacteria group bacterium]|nr:DUF4402 domain-containing protein [Patescibacteria group bacterium]